MSVSTGIVLEGFVGNQLRQGDAGYDEARKIYNGLVDKRPALIAQCTSTADIVAAVRVGRESGLEVSIRGGGHNVAGKAVTDGGLMIDLSLLNEVTVDPARKTARAGGGVHWGEFNDATQAHGLAVTGGVISTTGIAGLTLGGGFGWLMPKYGLALDSLISLEVVTADGSVITASADEHPDLFWALRGGGGNFGIVSTFEYQLYDVGPTIIGGMVAHPLAAAGDLLRFYREFTADLPDELMAVAALVHAKDGSGAKLAAVAVCHIGTPEQADKDLAPLLEFGTPALSKVGPMPYAAINGMLDEGYPQGSLNYWKSSMLQDLSDGAIDGLVTAYGECPASLGGVIIEHYHGEATRIPLAATSCELRQPGYNLALAIAWPDPAATDASIAWTRQTYAMLEPYRAPLRYVNYLAEDDIADAGDADAALRAVYPAHHERLAEIKRTYDPDNLFHMNLNIRPN